MCGIAGVFHYSENGGGRRVDRERLLASREQMLCRGPDDCGLWLSANERVGLAHRRLAVLDLSTGGRQPMADAEGGVQIVYNGEIYNFRELRAALESRGSRFSTETDTEVLLALYREEGSEFVTQLRGMFALALWDQESGGLLLARDPFGIKPLYYSDTGGSVYFASQVKALLRFPEVSREPDPAGTCGYFLLGSVPEPHTLFRGICAAAPGEVLEFTPQRGRRQVISQDLTDLFPPADPPAEHEPINFGAVLEDSVSAHLLSDAPAGFFLSAGLDSTSLVAAASAGGHPDIHTVTLGFDRLRGTAQDETVLAEQTAAHYGTSHQTVWVSREDFEGHLDGFLAAMDQPTIDGANTYFVSLASRRAGLTVALSGLGADELLGGYPSFRDVPRCRELIGPLRAMPQFGRLVRRLSYPLLGSITSPKAAGLFEYGGTMMGAYLLRRGLFMPWELEAIVGKEMYREGWPVIAGELLDEAQLTAWPERRQQVSVAELRWYMRNQLLRDADWAGMAHSLEIRVPFVDRVVARAVFRQSARKPFTKLDMLHSLKLPPPPALAGRTKTGFVVPVREWLAEQNPHLGRERGLRGWARVVFERYTAELAA